MQYKCISCFRKHISACKSFGRQILDGHGEGGTPDHRIDFQGELVNSEYHAEIIDKTLIKKIRLYRRVLQSKKFNIELQDLYFLDIVYYYSYKLEGNQISKQIQEKYNLLQCSDDISNINSDNIKRGCGCNKK